VQKKSGITGYALHRIRLRRRPYLNRASGAREWRDERLEAFFEGDPFAIRCDRVLRGVRTADVLDLVPSRHERRAGGHADADQREVVVPDIAEVNAGADVIELRVFTAFPHEDRLATAHRHDEDAGVGGVQNAAGEIGASLPEDDLLPVG
jgi:hypothetical protein